MNKALKPMIPPDMLAFDFDGVLADTMALFLDIAREEFQLNSLRYEDIRCYNLEDCLDIDAEVIAAIINRIMEGSHPQDLKVMDGAPETLLRLNRCCESILLVTARPHAEPVRRWVNAKLPLDPARVETVATGSFRAKAEVLLERGISYFVEDRLETCFALKAAGIAPILYRQPWNREPHPFVEVSNWQELARLIDFDREPIK